MRVPEDPKIYIGSDHQAVIPSITRTPSTHIHPEKAVWNPEGNGHDWDKFTQFIDVALGDDIMVEKPLRLLARRDYDVEKVIKMIKKKRNYFKEYFKVAPVL